MAVSMYSLFMAVLWSSVLTVLLYVVRKHPVFMAQFGLYNILLLYLFSIGRLVLPLEFPFTRELPAQFVLNPVTTALNTVVASLNESPITIGSLLIFLWLFVAIVLIVRFIKEYLDNCRKLSYLKENTEQRYQDTLDEIQYHSSRYLKVTLLIDPYINSPESIGIIKRRILLPDQEYTDTEIEFILRHEYQHFLNRDLLLKWLIHIYCCLLWWNPCVYLLKRDLAQILENKCDLAIAGNLRDEKKADYLVAILKVYKNEQSKKQALVSMAFLGNKKKSSLEERFLLISQNKQKRKSVSVFQTAFSTFVIALFFVSYLFVVQPDFEAPIPEIETSDGATMIEPENITIRKNSDGIYSIVSQYGEQIINEENAQAIISKGGVLIDEESTQKKD